KAPRRERQGERPARLGDAISDISGGVEGGVRLISRKGAKAQRRENGTHTKTQRGRLGPAAQRQDRAKRLVRVACGDKPGPKGRTPSLCLCVRFSSSRLCAFA